MDLPTLSQLVPQILIALVIVGTVAWFRKQDSEQLASLRGEVRSVRMSAMPDDAPGNTGRHAAVVDNSERIDNKLEGLTQTLGGLTQTLGGVAVKLDNEISESKRFRETHAQRVTALETDVRWLRRGGNPNSESPGGR